jgi:hypothetical protein
MVDKPKDAKDAHEGKAKLIMVGRKEKVNGWRGELYVALVQHEGKFQVVPDSTDGGDQDSLPEVKTFEDKKEAMAHFWKLEKNKRDWK